MEDKSKIAHLENTIDSMKDLLKNLSKRLDVVEHDLRRAEKENLELINNNIDLDSKIDAAEEKVKEADFKLRKANRRIAELEKEIKQLNAKLYRKNSRNSSIPPSQDPNRPKKNKSLRKPSNRKIGGQKGHEGFTLEMSSMPSEVIDHYPEVCENCGKELTGQFKFQKKRQIVDLPEFLPNILEHRVYQGACSCGCLTSGRFPKGVNARISYGPRTEAVIAYLSVRQYVPIKRIEEMLRQLFGLKISASTVKNKLGKSSDKLLQYYTWIQDQIKKSRVVGSDETGCRVNGNQGWIWTWQTDSLTYLRYSATRGSKTVKDTFPEGLPESYMVHDCLNQQFNIKCKGHQICIAHLLRELNYFIEQGSKWSQKFKDQLNKSLWLLERIKANPDQDYNYNIWKINKDVDSLLKNNRSAKGKLQAFIRRIKKHRGSLFRYLKDPAIPPDNNGSERALRNVKVKTKVSGMFKTDLGADEFAIIRSVIDTFIKRDQPIMKSLWSMVS